MKKNNVEIKLKWNEEKEMRTCEWRKETEASSNIIKIIMNTWKQIDYDGVDNIVLLCQLLSSFYNLLSKCGNTLSVTQIRHRVADYSIDPQNCTRFSIELSSSAHCFSGNIMEFPIQNHHKFVDCTATLPSLLFSAELKCGNFCQKIV